MRFSIYTMRENPNFVIFDRQLGSPAFGEADDYECAGVFKVDGNVKFCEGSGLDSKGELENPNTAKITKLWPVLVEQ